MGSWRGSRPVSLWIQAQDHKPTGLRALWGQGWATAHDALGAPQRLNMFPASHEAKGGSWEGCILGGFRLVDSLDTEPQGWGLLVIDPGWVCPSTHTATPVPTPGRRDKLIVTPFPSPCGAPGSLSQCRKLTQEAKPACLS